MPRIDLFTSVPGGSLPAAGRRVVEDLDASARLGARAGTVRRKDMTFAWTFGEQRLTDVCRPDVLKISMLGTYDREALTEFVRAILEDDRPPRIPLQNLAFMRCDLDLVYLLDDLHFRRYQIGPNLICWHLVTGQRELL
jgi:hypothetical protein